MFTTTAGLIESSDIVEHSELSAPWELQLRQMSPGQFRGLIEYLQINGILLYRERYSHRVMGTGATPSGYFMFGSPSSLEHDIRWCGREALPERIAFGESSKQIDFVVPEDSHHVILLVPEDKLRENLGLNGEQRLEVDGRRHLCCPPAVGNRLIATIHRLINDYSSHPELLASHPLCTAIEWQLLGIILEAFHVGNTDLEPVSPRMRRRAFCRALDFSEAIHRPVSGSELARVAGVSRRVLEMSFKENLSISPARFLRWNRMNRVHSDLIAAEPHATLVKHIAAQWGFAEMGRFAVEYKWLFGESPSETLACAGSRPPIRLADVLI